MTNLFYALLFIISGSFNSGTANNHSNPKQVKFEQSQNKNASTATDNNEDDDDDESEKEDPNEN